MENKYDLIDKYLNGKMSVREQTEFEDILRKNSNLMNEYLLRRDLNNAIAEDDIMDLRDHLEEIINSKPEHTTKQINIRLITSIAALFVGLIIVSVIFLNKSTFDNTQTFNKYYQKYPSVINSRSLTENHNKLFIESFQAYEQGDYDVAIKKMKQLLIDDGKNNLVLFYLALAEMEQEQWDESEKHFNILVQDSNHIFCEQAHWYLALTYLKKNDIVNSKKILDLIVRENFTMHEDAESLLSDIN